jgi:hypothetical protein
MMDRDTLIKDYAAIIDRAREESEQIEQILGKALGYPWYKDDPDIFPRATEADGVCVGVETAWSLAMIAADRIKELSKSNPHDGSTLDSFLLQEENEKLKKELKRLERTNSQLRDELSNPPADVQEYVLHKLGVREIIMELEKEIRNLKGEK